MPKSPEVPKKEEKQEEDPYAAWMEDYPEKKIVPEALREGGPEIAELEVLFNSFESDYSLDELNAIIDLTAEEAPNHPVREPARKALIPIVAKLNILKKETNISADKYTELEARYRILSKAVGMINNNKVRH